jgi:small-conductance mechanosensitive channel
VIDQIWRLWPPLLWTAVDVGVAYAAGHLVRILVNTRLAQVAARTVADWDDALVKEITRRVPFWTLLVGLYFALPRWPLSFEHYAFGVRVLSALGVISFTLAAAAVATRLVLVYGPRVTPGVPVSGLTQNLVRIILYVLGALVVLDTFNYKIAPYLAALGVGGLAVALALQEPLSNLFAGIVISLARQIRIGDYIRLDSGAEGYVQDFNWRSTRLKQLGDNQIIVPNAKLAQAIVTNFSLPAPEIGVGVDVTVDWASDLAKVERVALDVGRDVMTSVPGGVPAAAPSVRFHSFTDTGVRFSIGLRARTFADQFVVKHEFLKRLHAAFAREGILISMVAHALIKPEPEEKP